MAKLFKLSNPGGNVEKGNEASPKAARIWIAYHRSQAKRTQIKIKKFVFWNPFRDKSTPQRGESQIQIIIN